MNNDIPVSVLVSEKNKKTIGETLKGLTCRFAVIIIVLDKDGKVIDSLEQDSSFEKGVIVYQRPVNIEKARTLRDKLVEAGVSEIKDCFYDKDNQLSQVENIIRTWNNCPEKEDRKLKLAQYITLPKVPGKDASIHLYASAMIGKMGELLLKLNTLANNFADVMLDYFSGKKQSAGSLSAVYSKNTNSPENSRPADISCLKKEIKNALTNNSESVLLPSEALPRLPKILLIGDSGVGKSLVANYIHETVLNRLKNVLGEEEKSRPARIGIPEFEKKEDDLEYALFGYAPGAYTGANENGNPGLLLDNICQVVFLDEIGAATSSVQNKLLTYLDGYKVRPRGLNHDIFCPTLVVAATNERNKLNDPQAFRSDLLARFTDRLVIPNIKERINDNEENLLYLLDCILQVADINPEPKVTSVGKEAFATLFEHFRNGCTGNFRELENLMREACEQARKDKRDYMVQADVTQAIDNLHLTLTTAPMEAAAPSFSSAEESVTNHEQQEISEEQINSFLRECRILKKQDDIRRQIIDIIMADNTKGYSRIIRELSLTAEKTPKSFPSAVQRLSEAFRKQFNLPSCRKAEKPGKAQVR